MDLTKRTVRNSLYNLVSFIYPIILSFCTTPFIVGKLGSENYGIYALATSFVGFLAFLDFGVSPALVKYISEHNARGEKEAINRFFSVSVIFYGIIGVVFGLAIMIFGATLAADIFKVSPQSEHTLKLVFMITGVGFLGTMLLGAYASFPGALQRFDLPSRVNLGVTTFSVAVTLLLVFNGKGVVAITALAAAVSLGAVLIYRKIDQHLVPELKVTPHLDREIIRKLFVFGGYATIGTIGGVILFQFDKILIGSVLGAKEVTYYVLPGTITLKINAAVATLTAVIFPLSSELLARGENARLQNLYVRATRIILTLIAIFVTPMYILSHAFLLFWLGPEFAENSTTVMQILLATYSVLGLSNVATHLAIGANKPQAAAAVSISAGVLNVILLLILMPKYGLVGAAVAFLISILPMFIFIRYVEKIIVQTAMRKFYIDTVLKLAIPVAIGLIVPIILLPLIHNIIVFLLVYGFTLAVAIGSMFLFNLIDPADRTLITAGLRKMTGTSKGAAV